MTILVAMVMAMPMAMPKPMPTVMTMTMATAMTRDGDGDGDDSKIEHRATKVCQKRTQNHKQIIKRRPYGKVWNKCLYSYDMLRDKGIWLSDNLIVNDNCSERYFWVTFS